MSKKKNYGKTRGGVVITREMIDELAKEAEAGYDIEKLVPRRGRPPIGSEAATVFHVRLDPELKQALDSQAGDQGTTASELARRILRDQLMPPSVNKRRRRA